MKEMTQSIGHTRKTMGGYVASYRKGGIAALIPRHSQGRHRRLSKMQETELKEINGIQRTWFLKGKQRKIPTHGKHGVAKLIGCLNYETGEILCQEKETYIAGYSRKNCMG
jgi:hypothetical protein